MSTHPDPQNPADRQEFDEEFGPVRRRVRRFTRRLRWWTKGILGLQPTILVEMRWRLGDEIMALPVYDRLRTRHPKARLEILTNYPDLFIGNPSIDAVNPQRRDPDKYLLLRGAPRDRHRIAHELSVGRSLSLWNWPFRFGNLQLHRKAVILKTEGAPE